MKAEYLKYIKAFAAKKVLVIGDFILDIYLKGFTTRLSPEAPVPVVDVMDKLILGGGAANTAINVRTLGAEVTLCSVIGDDDEGDKAIQLLTNVGVDTAGITRVSTRKTITKTRVMVGSHVVTRFDYGTDSGIDVNAACQLIDFLNENFNNYDAIIISDYNKGVVSQTVLNALWRLQKESPKFLAVDSKRLTFFKSLNPSFVKPNYEEGAKLIQALPSTTGRVEQIINWGTALYDATGADIIALTLDADGAMIFKKEVLTSRVCVPAVPHANVAGAGDTFISAFVLAFIAGADVEISANIACAASTIAVRKEATASCNDAELKAYFASTDKVIQSLEDLAQLCENYRAQGKRIVFTNGCFDILHSGHVSYLNRAKQLGDVLIVGINNDQSIKRIKGASRPINPLNDRMHVLAGLSSINHIISFGDVQDDTPISLIKVVKPDIFVKGGDYTREKLPEADTVEAAGGEIVLLSLVADHSTTNIIQQIYKTSTLAVA